MNTIKETKTESLNLASVKLVEDTTQPENIQVSPQVTSKHSEMEEDSDEDLSAVMIDLELLAHYPVPTRRSGRIPEPTTRYTPNVLVALMIREG